MAITVGSCSVDDSGAVSGSGLSKTIFDSIVIRFPSGVFFKSTGPQVSCGHANEPAIGIDNPYVAMKNTLPDLVAARQALAALSEGVASALAGAGL